MEQTPLSSFLIDTIKEKGWLAVSDIYFDNAINLSVYHSRGYVAIAPNDGLVFFYTNMDAANTFTIEDRIVVMDKGYSGQQQVITCQCLDCIQHVNFAMYSHYRFYADEQDVTPIPKIPTEKDMEKYVKNPETGLYEGADIAEMVSGKRVSVVSMYDKDFPYNSAAVIDWWKLFEKNRKKFNVVIRDYFGISDLI